MKEYRLSDIIDIKHGFAFDGEYISPDDNGIVLVTPGNFKIGGGFQEEKCKFFIGEIPKEYILEPGAFVVTMTDLSKGIDTLGYSAIIPKCGNRSYLHNQRIGLVSFISDECDEGYIYYLMHTHAYQRSIANSSTGATVHHTSPAKIKEYRFRAPELSRQRCIAKILATYDNLIENNQKQIKLLEEAARRLYKEWFVDLRFPGHETTRIVEGVPEGWKKHTINDICLKINSGGTPSRHKQEYWVPPKIKWYKTKELQDEWLIISEENISEIGLNSSSAKLFPPYTILMAIYASPTLGRLGILASEATCNQAALCLIADQEVVPWQWLFQKLFELRDSFNAVAKGAGQQNISAEVVKRTELILPVPKLLNMYANLTNEMFAQRLSLQRQCLKLAEARDRLLPKLMSGKIEV